ncbi:hypothetical protein CRUP_007507 [Coryphaenoides rupestris]|nr:hypothetical protein CRUP_007507 [Coryphaenoides rupestris]
MTAAALDDVVTQFASYEDFLHSNIPPSALYYLEDEELARQLVELGQWGSVLTREEFQSRKVSPALRNQHRDRNAGGQEVSGYIDYAHRLQSEDFEAYFSGKKRLMPRPSDLSFYNRRTQMSTSHSSLNYEVITYNASGLVFQHKTDRKILELNPWPTEVRPERSPLRQLLLDPATGAHRTRPPRNTKQSSAETKTSRGTTLERVNKETYVNTARSLALKSESTHSSRTFDHRD